VGVLGSLGIYRAAFQSIGQSEPITQRKIQTLVVAIAGVKGLGAKAGAMVHMVATDVKEVVFDDSGHFVPEERPDAVVSEMLALRERTNQTSLKKGA